MKRIATLVLALGIGLGASACVSEDSVITCDNLADFLYFCDTGCTASWDCEYYYDGLYLEDQYLMDDCSDCLADNLDAGVCEDCEVLDDVGDPWNCSDLLSDYLGVDCVWY
jgi:hypothetical protein